MPIIIALVIAIVLILISWTWHNLGGVDKNKKVITIIVSLIIIFLITLIVFNISTKDIQYNKQEELDSVRNILVLVFTFINGLITMPAIAKIINRVYEKDIDTEQATKRIAIVLIIFIILLIIECGYLKDIQRGILSIYQNKLTQ